MPALGQIRYPILTEDWLNQRYSVEKLSVPKIATMVGCANDTIRRNLINFDIQRRTISEAKKGV
jgi:hypothetical protein